jgi:hypothetical protein
VTLACEALGEKSSVRGDPSNLEANLVAAWALTKKGNHVEARKYFSNQIGLLNTDQYRVSSESFNSVLNGLPDDSELLLRFLNILSVNSPKWNSLESDLSLLSTLYQRNLREAGDKLATVLAENACNNPSLRNLNNEVLSLTQILIQHGLITPATSFAQAIVVQVCKQQYTVNEFENLVEIFVREGQGDRAHEIMNLLIASSGSLPQREALQVHADWIELCFKLRRDGNNKIEQFLKNIPFNERETLLKNFQNVCLSASRWSSQTLDQLRLFIAKRYKEWEPQISEFISQSASRNAKSTSALPFGCLFGCLSYIALAGVLSYPLVQIARTRSMSDPTGVLTVGSFFCSVIVAIWGGLILKQIRRNRNIQKEIDRLEAQEKEAWSAICNSELSAPRPNQIAIFVQVSVLIGIVLIFACSAIGYVLIASEKPSASSHPMELAKNGAAIDELNGSSFGTASGIEYVQAVDGRGAFFSRRNESRIQYGTAIPSEGTLEWWIKISSGYSYSDYVINENQSSALIFTTDCQGGDVTWPGSTWFYVASDGTISLIMAATKYDGPKQVLTAKQTKFRFGEWHSIGISFGNQGQFIMLDGALVASAGKNTQPLGQGGNHETPLDLPTMGEAVSGFWDNNRYDGGFEGIVDRFRISQNQKDWYLSLNRPK